MIENQDCLVLIKILTPILLHRHAIFDCLIGECLGHLDAEKKVEHGVVSWHVAGFEVEAEAFVAVRFLAVMSIIDILPCARDSC